MTTRPLDVLLVEDSADDGELMLLELRRAGYAPAAERVETAAGFRAALAARAWDVILCDNAMPGLDAQRSLDLLRESGRDVPLVVVSGTIGEERAVELMRAGATDFVMKGSLGRLAPAVEREVRQAAERRERRRAEREARDLAAIVASSDDAIVGKTLGGTVTSWNAGAERLYGYAAGDIVGRSISTLISPDRPDEEADLLGRVARGERVEHFETERVRKDGTRVHVSVTLSPVRDDAGRVVGASAIARDITPRRRAERRAKDEAQVADTLNRLALTLAAELDLRTLVQAVTDEATRLSDAAFGAFFHNVTGDGGESYLLYTLSGASRAAFDRYPIPRATELFGPTFRGEGVIRLADVTADPRFGRNAPYRGLPDGHPPVRSYLAVPVMSRSGGVLGGLFFGHPEPGVFTDRHERLAVGIAATAAVALDNARLFDETRRAAHAAERAALLLANVRDAVVVTDPGGIVTYWNDGATRLFGWTAAEIVGRPYADRYPEPERAFVADGIRRRVAGEAWAGEYESRRKDGSRVWIDARVSRITDPAGAVVGVLGLSHDITDRKRTEDALREREALLQTIITHIPCGVFWKDRDSVLLGCNNQFARDLGAGSPDDLVGKTDDLLATPAEADAFVARDRRVIETGEALLNVEEPRTMSDGRAMTLSTSKVPLRGPGGAVIGVLGVYQDITDQKRAENALRGSEERYRSLADAMPQIVWVAQPDGYHEFYNRRWYDYTGLSFDDSRGEGWNHVFHPDDQALSRDRWRHSLATGETYEVEYRCRRHDGEYRWFLGRALPQRDDAGRVVRWFGTCTDIHDFKRAEVERAELFARLNLQIERMPLAYLLSGPDMRYVGWNPAAERIFGFSRAEVLGKHPFEVVVPPQSRAFVGGIFARLAAGDMDAHGVSENVTRDGRTVVCEWYNTPLFGPDGGFQGVFSLAQDVTARRQAEAVLRLRERAMQAVVGGIVITDATLPDNPIVYASPGFERLTGYAEAEVVGRNCRLLQGKDTDPRAVATVREAVRDALPCQVELLNYRKDGTPFWNELHLSPVTDDAGRLTNFVGAQADVTGRRKLEEQFRQAQKMDAVGRLAGGVAHDFNNLLTVINGYGEIVHDALPPGHPSRELVGEITKAGERAAGLTRQLLAFSRQTVLETKVLDPNALVRDCERMLGRLLGDDIDLALALAPDLGRVKTDPGQLEQAVVNLCVNARDAMPRGGKITVETRNVDLDAAYAAARPDARPGPHVVLSVSDTGAGMAADVQARIFEPFFTTKEQGKGTGLGLAMVFGFVKQSGGHIGVHSAPGRGSAFKLYLPRVGDAPLARKSGPIAAPMPHGVETVLLVEDEDAVRALGRHVLRMCGYTVLEAANGRDAVRATDGHAGPLHLLVTDVVMPGGMGGRQVAEAVVARHPETKVLFTSGYTDDAVVRHGILEEGTHFLQKPFSPTALAQKVRDVLDGKA